MKHIRSPEDAEFTIDNVLRGEARLCGGPSLYDDQPITFGQSVA